LLQNSLKVMTVVRG